MTVDLSALPARTAEQNRELALQMGLSPHWKAKNETIIKMICDSLTPQRPVEVSAPVKQTLEIVINTEQQVLDAIEPFTKRQPAFKVAFPQDGTWIFECKGASESGHLSVPLRVIKQKAESVSRGRLVPFIVGREGSATDYTSAILGV